MSPGFPFARSRLKIGVEIVVDGDRRRFAREACLLTVHLRVGTHIYEGTLVNISENGAYMATQRTVAEGTEVQVRFRHPWTDRAVTGRAMVMRNVAPGSAGASGPGIGLALLDTLSDLEDEETISSGSFPQIPPEQVELLRARAREAAPLPGSRPPLGGPRSAPQAPPPPDDGQATGHSASGGGRPPRPARVLSPDLEVLFHASGRRNSMGTLTNISAGGLQVACAMPPDPGRLVRLEIVEGSGQPNLRIAGRVTWSNPDVDSEQPRGFGVRILHFLSAADERRFASFLIELKERTKAAGSDPG